MSDALGPRAKFGVLAPSTNTIVQPEFDAMRPRGVTNHHSRLAIPDRRVTDDASFLAMIGDIRAALLPALESVLSCRPDYVVLGMSSETFWDGLSGSKKLRASLEKRAKCGVAMGSDACRAALRAYGRSVRRLGIITPHRVNRGRVDAIVQVGTNLAMAELAASAELWLDKPVIAINSATYWYALREYGIKDRIPGWGSLLSDH